LKISDAQELIRKKYFDRDSARGLFATYTWFIEEVGELAEALIEKDKESIEEEIADVFAWLLSIANLVGVNVQEAFVKKYVSQQG
jgi:NTP pyrophosphatase (non-canonical NTP hydrolase)